jgi:HSP20 family protein
VHTQASRLLTAFFDGVPVARLRLGHANFSPSVDVWETASDIVVVADAAGIDERQIEVRFDGDTLTIRGRRSDPQDQGRARVRQHQMELAYGLFERTVALPLPVDGERITASYKNGLLTITCPKLDRSGTTRVIVTRADEG